MAHGSDEHSHTRHNHDHNVPRGTLYGAAIFFLSLGVVEVVIGRSGALAAVGVDGLHNMVDGAVLALNAVAARYEHNRRWAVGMPFFGTVAIVASAIAFLALEQQAQGQPNFVAALGLSAVSLVANGLYAWKLHTHHDHAEHGSRNTLVAKLHLVGDFGAATLAAIGYTALLGGAPSAVDLAMAIAGTVVIVLFHWQVARDSLSEWRGWADVN